jgi:hypothetical protein
MELHFMQELRVATAMEVGIESNEVLVQKPTVRSSSTFYQPGP